MRRNQVIPRVVFVALVLTGAVQPHPVRGQETDKQKQERLAKFWADHSDALKHFYQQAGVLPGPDIPCST